MDVDERFNLIVRGTVEVVTREELRAKLESGEKLKGYIGFEPSGLIHVGWLVWMFKVKDLVDAGVDFYVLEATWHAFINDKLGGDMNLIRKAALITRKTLEALGVEPGRVKYIDAEELASDKDYWGLVLRVLKATTLARMKRALTIMGRKAEEAELDTSKLVYPAMQVSDIYYMDLDIALGGMDQRKAHMLARDLAPKLGFKKPIALHTPLITGLAGGRRMEAAEIDELYAEFKMSKSKPENTILVHDEPEAIKAKLRKAYCPARVVEFNPVMEIAKYILFARPGFVLHVDRPTKYGGPVDYYSYEDLEKDYVEGKLHPLDLKNAVADALAKLLEPVRKALLGDPEARRAIEEIERARAR